MSKPKKKDAAPEKEVLALARFSPEQFPMSLDAAVDMIRDQLCARMASEQGNFWSMILRQIAKTNGIDGTCDTAITEAIGTLLRQLPDAATISMWRQTEAGMMEESEDDCLFPDCLRMDLEMELLQQVTELAWWEAEQLKPKSKRKKWDRRKMRDE